MNLDEVKIFLDGCERWELVDHAFGDMEIGWLLDDIEVAGGYFGSGVPSVWVKTDKQDEAITFSGEHARALKECGTLKARERNDSTGPDTFQEGVIMPGLTLEGVREELTNG